MSLAFSSGSSGGSSLGSGCAALGVFPPLMIVTVSSKVFEDCY